jgi:hypothetical protein
VLPEDAGQAARPQADHEPTGSIVRKTTKRISAR